MIKKQCFQTHSNKEFFSGFNSVFFYGFDYAPAKLQVKIKEGMYIDDHLTTTASVLYFFHALLFHLNTSKLTF